MLLSVWTLFSIFALALANPFSAASRGIKDLAKKQTTALNEFLAILLENIPVIDDTLAAVIDVLTDFEQDIADLTGVQTTQNELGAGSCTEWTIIFARGTTEPGNVGVLVGPPFFEALEALVGTSALTIQGVNDYPATIDEYLEGGSPTGTSEMAAQIEQAFSLCPDTKLISSGYSQGAQLVHKSAALLPADVAEWITAVVVFGDPDDGQAISNVAASKVDTFCNTGDDICQDGIIITVEHLIYAEDASAAASFVVSL